MQIKLGLSIIGAALGMALCAPCVHAASPTTTGNTAQVDTTILRSKSFGCSTRTRVLLLQDSAPFGTSVNQVVLDALEVSFLTAGSESFAEVLKPSRLGKCSTVIVASNQSQYFYSELQRYIKNLSSWVLLPRRTLVFHGADNVEGGWNFALTLNLTKQSFNIYYNSIANENSPLTRGLPYLMAMAPMDPVPVSSGFFATGPLSANHVVLQASNINITNADVVPSQTSQSMPTMVDYCYVLGRVIASTVNVERAFPETEWGVTLLWNELYLATMKPGCQPNAQPAPVPEYLYGYYYD